MSRAWMKIGMGAAVVAALLAALVVLWAEARHKGKLSYCRNNLRRLGGMAVAELPSYGEEPPEERGRAFWQWLRERRFYNPGKKAWVRMGVLNPFGCPVLGRQPLDLTEAALDSASYAKLMADPGTIDYRGPKALQVALRGGFILGADREGNHPSGGNVLFTDLSVRDQIDVQARDDLWKRAAAETTD